MTDRATGDAPQTWGEFLRQLRGAPGAVRLRAAVLLAALLAVVPLTMLAASAVTGSSLARTAADAGYAAACAAALRVLWRARRRIAAGRRDRA